MSHSKLLLIGLLFAIQFTYSCKSSNKNADQQLSATESQHQNEPKVNEEGLIIDEAEAVTPVGSSENDGFFTYQNARFSFAIDAPTEWSVVDKSGNGDGFFIDIPGEDSIEIRIYGERYDEALAEFYEADCKEKSDFEFDSGFTGTRCVSEKAITYSVINKTDRINVYISNWDKAQLSNKVNLTTLIKSLRFINDEAQQAS